MGVTDYDLVLNTIGHFGKFQKKVLCLLSLVSGAGGLAIVVFVFTGFEQSYRCKVGQCESGPHITYFRQDNCNTSEESCWDGPQLPPWYERRGSRWRTGAGTWW